MSNAKQAVESAKSVMGGFDEAKPSLKETFQKLEKMNKLAMLGFARSTPDVTTSQSDLKGMDDELLRSEILSELYGDDVTSDLMSLGLL